MAKYNLVVEGKVTLSHDNLAWLCDKAIAINKVCPWANAKVDKTEEAQNG